MGDWTGGYVTAIDYSVNFQDFLSPTLLRTVALLNGLEPGPLPERYTYCELGCGHGTTLITLAATNPDGDFHGIDFMPEHVVSARALAADGGVENVAFHEVSFADAAAGRGPDLPVFDFIVLHGVYTWVSPDNRAAIRRFINDRLKPGGIVYVGFNALPGWMDGLVIQKLLKMLADRHWGPPEARIEAALGQLEGLADAAPHALRDSRTFDSIKELAHAGRFAYLAHEYLTDHWEPMYFLDVAQDMADARLTYAGTCYMLDNFNNLSLTDSQRALVDQLPTPAVRETVKDYCVNSRFRRDVFVRGARRLTPAHRDDRLRSLRLALKVPTAGIRLRIKVPVGEATLNERAYRPIFTRLAAGACTVDQLLALPEIKDGATLSAGELVGMLIGSQQVEPTPPAEGLANRAAVRALNRKVAERAWYEDDGSRWALAAPGLANGWVSDTIERLIYLALTSGIAAEADPLARFLAGPVQARGYRVVAGTAEPDEATLTAHLTQTAQRFVERTLPLWRRLDIL